MSQPLPSFNSIYQDAKNEDPELLQKCEPKKFTGYAPGNSAHSAVAARFAAYLIAKFCVDEALQRARTERNYASQVVLNGEIPFEDNIARTAYTTTLRSQEFGHPTYFLAPEFLKAVVATKLPAQTPVGQFPWPMEAMTFIFPKGALRSPSDGECTFLTVAHIPKDWKNYPPYGLPPVRTEQESIAMFTGAEENGSPMFAASIPVVGTTTDNWQALDLPSQLYLPPGSNPDILKQAYGTDFDPSLKVPTAKDTEFLRELELLALKLILVTAAAPQHIKSGTLARPASTKKGKKRCELWNPNVIGEAYQAQREGNGTHASPQMHWRRGHIRSQPFGPRNEPKYRALWIEPMLINAPEPLV